MRVGVDTIHLWFLRPPVPCEELHVENSSHAAEHTIAKESEVSFRKTVVFCCEQLSRENGPSFRKLRFLTRV